MSFIFLFIVFSFSKYRICGHDTCPDNLQRFLQKSICSVFLIFLFPPLLHVCTGLIAHCWIVVRVAQLCTWSGSSSLSFFSINRRNLRACQFYRVDFLPGALSAAYILPRVAELKDGKGNQSASMKPTSMR